MARRILVAIIVLVAVMVALSVLNQCNQLTPFEETPEIITKDIGKWSYAGIEKANEQLTAYYNLADRSEEAEVTIADYDGEKWKALSESKACEPAWALDRPVIDCFPGGIYWSSGDKMINVRDSRRQEGLTASAYDLEVCRDAGCEDKYIVYAPKEIYLAYRALYQAGNGN